MKPQISVIMSVYNGERFLKYAIESILAQTYKNFEFIIINDGSKDQTDRIIRSYQDSRINYITDGENLGLTARLNQGIKLAKGKYIARMDADDISYPHRLEKQRSFLKSHPDVSVVGSTAYIIDDSGLKIRFLNRPEFHELIHWRMFFGCQMIHPTVMFRRSGVGDWLVYDEKEVYAQDYQLWLKLISRVRFYNIQEPLLSYRYHSKNISVQHKISQKEKSLLLTADWISKFLGEEISINVVKVLKGHSGVNDQDILRGTRLIIKLLHRFQIINNINENIDKQIRSDIFARLKKYSNISNSTTQRWYILILALINNPSMFINRAYKKAIKKFRIFC